MEKTEINKVYFFFPFPLVNVSGVFCHGLVSEYLWKNNLSIDIYLHVKGDTKIYVECLVSVTLLIA